MRFPNPTHTPRTKGANAMAKTTSILFLATLVTMAVAAPVGAAEPEEGTCNALFVLSARDVSMDVTTLTKEPFSLEQAMSLRYTTFLERSLANALAPSRNTGVLATSTHLDKRLRWAVGIFFLDDSLADTDGSVEGLENDWDIAARVNWVPFSSEDGSRLVTAGCSYSHIFTDASGLSIGQRPESRLVPKLIETPEFPGIRGGDRFGVELAWLEGSLSLQAEAIGLSIQNVIRASPICSSGGATRRSATSSRESVASTAARPVCSAG